MMLLQFDTSGGAAGGQLATVLVVVAVIALIVGVIASMMRRGSVPVSVVGADAHTRPYHADNRTGLVALLAGESLSRALDRALGEINTDGRRVVFVLRDSWSFWRFLGVVIGTLLTLGLWSRGRGYLVIAERRAP